MIQFLQTYGVWIVVGIILLVLLLRFVYSAGRHSQSGQEPVRQSQQTGTQTGTARQGDGGHRHGGCC